MITLTVEQKKAAIVEMLRAISPEVHELVAANIHAIWQAALRHNCTPPLDFLYAQREAVDFALAWLSTRVSNKRGFMDAMRTSIGRSRATSQSSTDGVMQGESCDWANTSGYTTYQNNADGFTRSRSQNDSNSYTYYQQQSWDRSRTRQDAQSRSDAVRQATATRVREEVSSAGTRARGYSRDQSGNYVQNPLPPQWDYSLNVPIVIPPVDINIPTPFGPITIPEAGLVNFSIPIRNEPPIGNADAICPPLRAIRCQPLFSPDECEIRLPSDDEVDAGDFDEPAMLSRPNVQAQVDVTMSVTLPIPAVGSLTISAQFQSGIEQRPKSSISRSYSRSMSSARGQTFARARSEGRSDSLAESRGSRVSDIHSRGAGQSQSQSDALSASVARNQSQSDMAQENKSDSYGSSQQASETRSSSASESNSWQRTESNRTSVMEMRKYSDAFNALNELRARIVQQIEMAKRTFRNSRGFNTGRIERERFERFYSPGCLAVGYPGGVFVDGMRTTRN